MTLNDLRVCTSQGWHAIREACRTDPGDFHARYTKEFTYWYRQENSAWLTFNPERQEWCGWSTDQCQPCIVAASWIPWQRAFDGTESPYFQWFVGGLTNASFNEVDRHVLEGHGDEIGLIEDSAVFDEHANQGLGAPAESVEYSRSDLLVLTISAAKALVEIGLAKGDRSSPYNAEHCHSDDLDRSMQAHGSTLHCKGSFNNCTISE